MADRTSSGAPVSALHEFDPTTLEGPLELVGPLRAAGSVVRLANPSLWDAIATAIVRQVIRAEHARKLYRHFGRSLAAGGPASARDEALMHCPPPDRVLEVSETEFGALGMAFKRPALRAAATAYLEHGEYWSSLARSADSRHELVARLMSVPRIGSWTAGAAVADFTNDFGVYPFSDLAVRTWAQRMAPELSWPNGEAEFRALWQRMTGARVSEWTALTLAWGGISAGRRSVAAR